MKTYSESVAPQGGAVNRGKRVSRKRARELFAKMKARLLKKWGKGEE